MSSGDPIAGFTGEYEFLSNFHASQVVLGGVQYPTGEHAYQAQKLPPGERACIAGIADPGEVKRLVRRSFGDPTGWQQVRVEVMKRVVAAKFHQTGDLAAALLATADRPLLEENWWGDTFWGCVDGVGENMLGRILMERRLELAAVAVRSDADLPSADADADSC